MHAHTSLFGHLFILLRYWNCFYFIFLLSFLALQTHAQIIFGRKNSKDDTADTRKREFFHSENFLVVISSLSHTTCNRNEEKNTKKKKFFLIFFFYFSFLLCWFGKNFVSWIAAVYTQKTFFFYIFCFLFICYFFFF